MKMRIRGNSIRLRITRPELAALACTGLVEDAICFGLDPAARLTYALRSCGTEVTVHHQTGRVEVWLPEPFVKAWATSETVGTEANVDIGDGQRLKVLVEKDFTCLNPQGEDQSGMFANPAKEC